MPQMAPISWLSLFMIFSITFLVFSIMNYFIFYPSMPNTYTESKSFNNTMNWKW